MKREEKNQQSISKIIHAAMREFALKSYGQSSINTICSEGDISKGVLYHYFRDKDEIYLACVKETFNALTNHLREHMAENPEDGVQAYFDARFTFFQKNPLYQNLFCEAVISPPMSLKDAVDEAKSDFDALNLEVLTGLLHDRRLRNGIHTEQAVEVILLFQDFVNARYQTLSNDNFDMAVHEDICRRSLDILLYGIVEQGGDRK